MVENVAAPVNRETVLNKLKMCGMNFLSYRTFF